MNLDAILAIFVLLTWREAIGLTETRGAWPLFGRAAKLDSPVTFNLSFSLSSPILPLLFYYKHLLRLKLEFIDANLSIF